MTHISEPMNSPETVAVQVRLTGDENDRLEAVARRLGCTKAMVLRFLIRNSEHLAVTLSTSTEQA